MQLRCVKRSSISVLLTGIIVLTLAACGVESDAPMPSASTMTDEELVSLIWNLPYSVTKKAEVEVDKALRENPDMSLEEQTELLKQLLTKLNEQVDGLSKGELTTLQYPWGELAPREQALCAVEPVACFQTKNITAEAKYFSKERVPRSQHGPRGPEDAFRHTYWNSAMCSRVSEQWARRFATAHESESPDNAETDMDFYNNEEGRDLCTDSRIAVKVKDLLDDGDLKIVIGGPNGRLVDSDRSWP